MKQSDSVDLHIEFAHRMLGLSLDLSPSVPKDPQVSLPVPEEVGEGRLHMTQLGAGTSFLDWNCSNARDMTNMQIGYQAQYLTFPFHLLQKPTEVGIDGVKQPIMLHQTDSFILGPSVIGTQTVHPDIPIHQLCLFLDAQTIESCFQDSQEAVPELLKRAFTRDSGEPFYLRGRATTAMGLSIRQMLTCRLQGGLARLYLEAKVCEVAALRLAQLTNETHAPRQSRLMRRDIDLLEEARDILLSGYADPPSLTELAMAVGLNRTKLKMGFKERFGTTVFGFIRSQRMQGALLLLSDGRCNVGEAAAIVGYNSVSAFAAAFKHEFGFSPRMVRGCEDIAELEGRL
ncbi:MAG: AraC family transcriptional regulator [Spirochaetaceae bacterium]|nr:MAG: AraC family transcriptional regulator [Spirochaetaceae bacterium]